jgi:TonB-linked SusC/RagA family outer membrane protein
MQVSKKLTVLPLMILACLCSRAQDTKVPADTVIPETSTKAQAMVTGSVTDAATGKALRGIRITYKNYSAAISDSTGYFALKVPSGQVSVLLEGEGFQSKEIALRGRSTIKAALYEDTYSSFYDGANLPFGTVGRSRTPYAATSIQTNGNWTRATETPGSYLQGRAAGLNAIRRSGTPNSGATLFLRGISSLYATNQPLVIVDGVVYDNTDYGVSIINNQYNDPFSTIDVRDIDNITVLKDASSTYGTKGANGVIIVTTARAKELGTKIDFSVAGGVNFTPANIPVLNASDYRTYLSDILKSKGMTDAQIQAQPYMNDDPNNPDYFRYHNNTNWQDQIFNQSSTKNVYLKVTGGDNIAKYALSLGYTDNKGIVRKTGSTKYNMRFNGDLNLSRKVTATTNLSFTFNEQDMRDQGASAKTNPIFLSLVKSPFLFFKDLSEKGVESPSLADRDTFNITNPLVITDIGVGINKNYRFLGSIGFNYDITKNFGFTTTFGITNEKVRQNFFIPRKGVTTDTLNTSVAYSRLGSQVKRLFALYNDSRISFTKEFKQMHQISSRLGVRYQNSKVEQDYGVGFNSATDELVSVGNGDNSLRRVGGDNGQSIWMNTYFNTDYSYSDKYFISVNVAMDGSSRFGKNIPDAISISGNKYALLPSVSAAWLLSSERFFKAMPVDVLKLRATYGLSGNDDIGNFTTRQFYVTQNLLGMQGLVRGGFGNDQLQWEQVKKANIGLDASFLNERVSISADVFSNKTDKMIIYTPVAAATGMNYSVTNSGSMTTSGVEASLNARILNKSSFKWDLGINIGTYKSKIDALPVDRILSEFSGATYITTAGNVPNLFYGYVGNGVFVSDAEASAANLSLRNTDGTLTPFRGGDIRFSDLNGDNIIDAGDRQVIGDPNPDFYGSFTNRFEYKRWALEALVTFVQGNDIYNYTRNKLEALSNYNNQTEAVLNRWRNNGHVTDIPKATWGDPMGNSRFSNRWIEDGSYMRLRTVSLTFQLPIRPGFIKYGTVYVNGNNLVTLTKYKSFDPEFSPTESIYGQGVDNTLEPQFRSVQLGIRVGL